MQIHIFRDAQLAGRAAATLIAAQLLRKPDSILGLATGSTPIPAYETLIDMHQTGMLDFSQAVSFNLDEYVGISPEHPCSYHHFMQEQLFAQVNIRPENVHIPDGNAPDLTAAAKAYDAAILQAGGIDLQLLGIGRNGHIGFNEPGEHFVYGCHKVALSQSTIQANRRFFETEADVPRYAVSLGIGSIMQARQVLLVATGSDKAEAVRRALEEDVSPQWQASILRTHPDVVFLLDEAAAGKLRHRP
ncbi:MAG: glucosamine-6-phosphate deaminase [Clostridiales bacterium]|nr:glucosamine-6-phosphate deaminase [Clostridiales bacterium]